MDNLPDLVLLQVFSYMPPACLVESVAQVCSRWRALSKAKCLWSGAVVTETSETRGKKLIRIVLGAAKFTCLSVECARIARRLSDPLRDVVVAASFDTSKDSLTIRSRSAYVCLLALHHLTDGIKELVLLEAPMCTFTTFESNAVWRRLDEMRALQHLSLSLPLKGGLFNSVFRSSPAAAGWGAYSALLSLKVSVTDDSSESLENTATAQSEALLSFVATKSVLYDVAIGTKRPQIDVLRHCQNLRRVRAPAVKGINVLVKCRQLENLIITSVHQDAVVELASVLYAPRVKQTLWYLRITTGDTMQDTGICTAIAGLSNLSRLDIFPPVREDLCYLPRLLKGLPRLQRLTLENVPAASTLDEIPADNISCVQFVCVMNSPCRDNECGLPALVRLIRRSPDLHMRMPIEVTGACIERHGAMRVQVRTQGDAGDLVLSSHPDTSTSTCRACTRSRSTSNKQFLYVCIDDLRSACR